MTGASYNNIIRRLDLALITERTTSEEQHANSSSQTQSNVRPSNQK